MKKYGFTLIELLVVILVIAILIAIVTPSLHAIKQSARTVLCGSNIKQLYFSLSVYNQNCNTLPHGFDRSVNYTNPPKIYLGNATYDKLGLWWLQVISEDVSNLRENTEIWCPSNKLKTSNIKDIVLCGNYGINRSICKDSEIVKGVESEFVGKPLSLDSINRASETILIVDSGYSIISWKGASDLSESLFDNTSREEAFYIPGISENANRTFSGDFCEDAIKGRHRNQTVNAIYIDGHLKSQMADHLFVKTSNDNYINKSPLWTPK